MFATGKYRVANLHRHDVSKCTQLHAFVAKVQEKAVFRRQVDSENAVQHVYCCSHSYPSWGPPTGRREQRMGQHPPWWLTTATVWYSGPSQRGCESERVKKTVCALTLQLLAGGEIAPGNTLIQSMQTRQTCKRAKHRIHLCTAATTVLPEILPFVHN